MRNYNLKLNLNVQYSNCINTFSKKNRTLQMTIITYKQIKKSKYIKTYPLVIYKIYL